VSHNLDLDETPSNSTSQGTHAVYIMVLWSWLTGWGLKILSNQGN